MTSPIFSEGPPTVGLLDRLLPTLLSLTPTPVLLFVSTSSDIYLRNQSLLQFQYRVLAPFAKLSLVTLVIGILLAALSKRHRAFRPAMSVYYLTGPVFLLFAFFRGLQGVLPGIHVLYGTAIGLAFWPFLLLIATAVLNRRLHTPSIVRAFAVFGMILLAYEGGTLLYNIWFLTPRTTSTKADVTRPLPSGSQTLPNIYHFVFDAYQTDLLEHTLSEETQRALGGFTYFPNNRAEWGWTPMSFGTFLSGRDYFYDRTGAEFVSAAFDSKASFLYWLKSLGYETVAFVPGGWIGQDTFFDRFVSHDEAAKDDLLPLNTEALWNLWLYSNTPAALRDAVVRRHWFAGLNEEDMNLLENGRLLPSSSPVTSYLGFERMMEAERNLSPTGRYTLVHVIIPHYPLKLRADCSYSVGSATTEAIEQAQCALNLFLEFTSLLKDLGRFDDSLILVHGDHGGPYRTENERLVIMGRNRSLDTVLLVKPMGVSARGELEKLDLETSLLIIPSIIMSSVTDAGSRPPRAAPWSRSRAVVPLVEGELIESAERILRRNGFSLGETRDIESSQYAAGAVISQDPPAYERGDDTTEVSVLVSSGPPKGPNVMPDFVGRDVAEVSEWLRQKQLPSSVIHKVSNPVVPEGMVVSQSPRAGAKTDGNTEIVFYVNAGN
jgi:hypothetical protein